ncbi:beta-galactosidase [Sphaerisporangium krabiense]|uniref:Beta-galactosidase n=1 Tax=Sphaerisporangium krabiense TaxID=763782 RepID=A0A7W8ZAQ3_9ACTN|nr:beta-galactosidase [Sphaerisporangium krabiense]MBB5630541.1 beta-galactosidase [Sphaerisporangium krabiense]GII62505.1 beta-galactosidase [Sphaerisporangium krabiense]
MLTRVPGLLFGGDYNPEQWPEEVWAEDVRLMREAGINLVTVAVFSWSRLEPRRGAYDFGWLDRVLGLLHAEGVAADLATATATPPPWLVREHPEVMPVDAGGTRLEFGSRQGYCPSSPVWREHTVRLARAMATRYGGHPALAMWHVGNEYADHTLECFCPVSAAHFRRWLAARYGDADGLNAAWGTSCWGQHYTSLDQVEPPRRAPGPLNPAQTLDWRRFCSDALLECFALERDALREITPEVPVTTNFMSLLHGLDYWKWAAEEDLVSDDAYPDPADPGAHVATALSYDLMRSLKNRPWLLLESAPSAVSWREVNAPKPPGVMRLHSLQAVAHGSDGAMFFQWRQAKYGPEKFHSALLPHGGTETRTWRETVRLGRDLRALGEVAGSATTAEVALVLGWDSWWGLQAPESMPSNRLDLKKMLLAWYAPLHAAGIAVDLVPPGRDLSGYRLVIAPNLYLCTEEQAAALAAAPGRLVVGPFSGVVDAADQVHAGGAPGPLRDLLGVAVEEFWPLPDGARQEVVLHGGERATASTWAEWITPLDAEPLARYAGGDLDGRPAVVRRGRATYVSCLLDDVTPVLRAELAAAGVRPVAEVPPGVEAARRGRHLFLLNHTTSPAALTLPAPGTDLLTGRPLRGEITLAARDAVVLRIEGDQ